MIVERSRRSTPASASGGERRRGEAPEREDAVAASRLLEMLDQLDRQLTRTGEDGDRAVLAHHAAPTGSRGMQIARSLPSRMKSRIS